ncbi:MAG: nucleotidyltransferase domain-containing protein [Candidatus Omnitrophica bacterium]|nr:nucleotidyltransferase domain-containing protein [Candidatus Omnitrophota bacterium]
MRLSETEIVSIRSVFSRFNGKAGALYLFGSRIDPSKRGGDIDLLLLFKNESARASFLRLDFLVALKEKLGERKIDLTLATEA